MVTIKYKIEFCYFQFLAILMLIISLTSCQTFIKSSTVSLEPLLQLSTEELARNVSVVQQISANYQGQKQTFIAQLQITKKELIMVGLTNFGAKLFTLRYDNQNINYQPSSLLKISINPAFMLSDLQLIYWPKTSINNALKSHEELRQNNLGAFSRQLFVGNEEAILIRYSHDSVWQGNVLFIQKQHNYELSIKTLEIGSL